MAAPRRANNERLWPAGCLGLILGIAISVCGLAALIALAASGGSLPALPAERPPEDLAITVQEAYLQQALAQNLPALPSGLASDIMLDLQAGNRLLFSGKLGSSLPGLALKGDVSGVVHLDARDGKLVISFSDLKVLGFALPAIGNTLANELTAGLNQRIDEQLTAGLGSDARLVGVTTDERQMILQVRWLP